MAREKQTARKSTTSRGPDPIRARMTQLLTTKRNSTSFKNSKGPFTEHGTLPPSDGKHITFSWRNSERFQGVKHKRSKPGEQALKEIERLQKSINLLIPRSAFHSLVREITNNIAAENDEDSTGVSYKYQTAALIALQEATEAYLAALFEDSYMCTVHAKRVTLFPKDMELCRKLRRIL